jgi:flagellar basal-body rod protein FlgC
MANLVEASRSYEANIAAIGIVKAMITRTLELGR